ncbi:hypothetical protein OI70_20205 [Dickeya fangzhongdai]|nr:hypothetical protein OI70_20205 [Dickeya fangzhongdai]
MRIITGISSKQTTRKRFKALIYSFPGQTNKNDGIKTQTGAVTINYVLIGFATANAAIPVDGTG